MWRRKEKGTEKAEVWRRKESPQQIIIFFVFVIIDLTTDRKRRLLRKFSVGKEAGEGLPEAADGLGFGLVVGQISS